MPGTARRGRRAAVKRVVKSKLVSDETASIDSTDPTAEETGDADAVEDDNSADMTQPELDVSNGEDKDDEINIVDVDKTKTLHHSEEEKVISLIDDDNEEERERKDDTRKGGKDVEEQIVIDIDKNDEEDLAENESDQEELTVDVEMKESQREDESKESQAHSTCALEEVDVPAGDEQLEDHATAEEFENPDTGDTTEEASLAEEQSDEVTTKSVPDKEVADDNKDEARVEDSETDMVGEDADHRVDTRSDASTPVKDEAFAEEEKKVPVPRALHGTEKPKPREEDEERPYPASLAKLRQLTVNIGPIRQQDLKSDKLHNILKLNDVFEIKFELRDKNVDGRTVKEKLGFVRIPFEITTPEFLVHVAYMLGNLHIDGRDMSVRFPEAFNKALDECKKYEEETRRLRASKLEKKKRQIIVKNVPANVTEETVRSLFPEAKLITLHMEETFDGSRKVADVLLDFETEEACIQCLDTNKDVFIEDCQLKIFRLFSEKKYQRNPFYAVKKSGFPSRPARGRGIGIRGSVQAMKIRARALGLRGVARGRGASIRGAVRGISGRTRGLQEKRSVSLSSQKVRGGSSRTFGSSMGPPGTPRGPVLSPNKPYRRQNSDSRRGSFSGGMSRDGQFAQARRQEIRGRQASRGSRGYGRAGYQAKREYHSRPEATHGSTFREPKRHESPRSQQYHGSPHRSPAQQRSPSMRESYAGQFADSRSPSSVRNTMQQRRGGSGYREAGKYSPPRSLHSPHQSSSREEDPVAMMNYLKTTLARMEEKISQRSRSRERYEEHSSSSSTYRGRGRGSPNRGRGGGRGVRGNLARKRPGDAREYDQPPKRHIMEEPRRESRGEYYGSQTQSIHTGARRESFGRGGSDQQAMYRHGREAESPRQRGYGEVSVDRDRRDSFGSRTETYHSHQMGGHGVGGRGGSSRGRGYGRGGQVQGQRW